MKYTLLIFSLLVIAGCTSPPDTSGKIQVILDTDANNEIDDQHAIAYLIFNDELFDIKGITTNRTWGGGPVEEHTREAERIVALCHAEGEFPVISGANEDFQSIRDYISESNYDGKAAVDLIVRTAHGVPEGEKLLLMPVGKLTNIALALEKDPGIISKVKVVWLGSNWPDLGEYNLENDTSAINPVIRSGVEMWICTVENGTAEVRTTRDQIIKHFAGKGKPAAPIEGRHGGEFTQFGDYLVNLWEHVEEIRSLFDMAAIATVKNPAWARDTIVYGPRWIDASWTSLDNTTDSVLFFRHYDTGKVMEDFWAVLRKMEE